MMERRLFVVIRNVADGLEVTLTSIEPEFPAPGLVAAFRVPGATAAGDTVLKIPGGSVLPTA